MDVIELLAVWLHMLGLVIVMGYYGVLGRILIPSLERALEGEALADTLAGIERRALPLVLLSVALLVVTGTYLLVINPDYVGLGHFFDTTWSTLMLGKHAVVIVLVGAGVLVDWLARDLPFARDDVHLHRMVRRLRIAAEAATALGALALLLTAAAQLSA
jgi:uncharacterized membrane protein